MALAGISTRGYYRGAAERLGFERAIGVIASHEPGVAGEFTRTSGIALRDVMESVQQDVAWSGGLLNRNGAPLEFSFSTMSDDLRYTVEVGGPGTAPERRLARIDALLGELGVDPGWGGIARRFPELQRDAPLSYGAWLGIRHLRAVAARPATTFKIYAEPAAQTAAAISRLLAEYLGAPVLPEGAAGLSLVGGAPDSDRCELYFELACRKPAVSTLNRLLCRAGLEARQDDLLGLMRSFHFRSEGGADRLAEARYGFSYSVLPGCRDAAFSMFVFASALAGGDGYLRRDLQIAALRRGWNLGCYAALTEPFAQRYFQLAFHNMLTFSLGSDCALGLQVSVSPPPQHILDS